MQNDSTIPTKVCTKCGRLLPLALSFGPRKSAPDGFRNECRDCINAHRNEYNSQHKEQIHGYYLKSIQVEENREKRRTSTAAWYEANSARKNAQRVARYKENPERERATTDAWRRANLDRRRAQLRAYRARKSGNGGAHTADDVRAQYERQHGRCYWCSGEVGNTYHVDHVVPLSLGGSNGPENLVVACPFCNDSKGAKHPMDWAGMLL